MNSLKTIFAEHGIPQIVITDGGPQFRTEFQDFARAWDFTHIVSSPRNPQSNGKAERYVQTVKQAMVKSAQSGDDQNLALLVYRTTRISSDIPSPAELLNSRKYSALLPTRAKLSKGEEREL